MNNHQVFAKDEMIITGTVCLFLIQVAGIRRRLENALLPSPRGENVGGRGGAFFQDRRHRSDTFLYAADKETQIDFGSWKISLQGPNGSHIFGLEKNITDVTTLIIPTEVSHRFPRLPRW